MAPATLLYIYISCIVPSLPRQSDQVRLYDRGVLSNRLESNKLRSTSLKLMSQQRSKCRKRKLLRRHCSMEPKRVERTENATAASKNLPDNALNSYEIRIRGMVKPRVAHEKRDASALSTARQK